MQDDIMPPIERDTAGEAPKTPESSENIENSSAASSGTSTGKKTPIAFIRHLKHLSRKQYIIIGVVAALTLGAVSYFAFFKKDPPPAPVVVKEEPPAPPPKPTTEASRLTGVQISPELNKMPVTGVMIENSPDARPQAGLKDAGVVFEAIAEGGITRFLALFMEDQPDYIGPVRSVRPYYLDFLVPFDAAIAHAGGSAEGLAQIRNEGVKDLDHSGSGGTYQRVSNRFAPHNLYTSRAKLLELQNRKGYSTSTFTGYPRKEKETPIAVPTAKSIDFAISRPLYSVHYDYDAASNSYKRVMGGQPHTDERSGEQIAPKVVIAIVANRSQNGIYSVYQTTGAGTVMVFQDGGLVEGTWEKADRKSMYTFKTADGQPLLLTPGRTWITLVTPGAVKHAP